jgi:hypothetical protein
LLPCSLTLQACNTLVCELDAVVKIQISQAFLMPQSQHGSITNLHRGKQVKVTADMHV